jgi:hypothetical protein
MLSWFKKKPDNFSSLPDLAEWERTCPDCDAIAGQLHAIFCLKEHCPFCRGQLAGCGCIKNILGLSPEESRIVDEFVDDTKEPLRTITRKWSIALETKGRIPYTGVVSTLLGRWVRFGCCKRCASLCPRSSGERCLNQCGQRSWLHAPHGCGAQLSFRCGAVLVEQERRCSFA